MAEHEHRVETSLPIDVLWDFVREMDHWAPYLTGYQQHEKHSETESTWTLKGDVGVLARTVTFAVVVTQWSGPDLVRFSLEGKNEPLTGEGEFRLRPRVAGDDASIEAPRAPRVIALLWDRFVRWLFRRMRGAAPVRDAASAGGAGGNQMSFRLRIEPGGPMAPMIDAMIQPAMAAAAEDLAERIVAHLERERAKSEEAR